MLWTDGAIAPAALASAFVCLPIVGAAGALAAALWRRHRNAVLHGRSLNFYSGLIDAASSIADGSERDSRSSRNSGGGGAGGGSGGGLRRSGTSGLNGAGRRVAKGLSAAAVLASDLARVSLEAAEHEEQLAKARHAREQAGSVRRRRVRLRVLVLLALSPLLALCALAAVLLLDVLAFFLLLALHVTGNRQKLSPAWRHAVVTWEVLLRQHRACRGALHTFLQSAPMAILQLVLLGLQASRAGGLFGNYPLLAVSAAVATCTCIALALALVWSAAVAKTHLTHMLIMCLRYQGSCVLPQTWAAKVGPLAFKQQPRLQQLLHEQVS